MEPDRVDQIVDAHKGDPSALIQVLLEIQKENRWLPRQALERVGQKLGVPMTTIGLVLGARSMAAVPAQLIGGELADLQFFALPTDERPKH